jgi:hypothetical protein
VRPLVPTTLISSRYPAGSAAVQQFPRLAPDRAEPLFICYNCPAHQTLVEFAHQQFGYENSCWFHPDNSYSVWAAIDVGADQSPDNPAMTYSRTYVPPKSVTGPA